jgi:hypothetical protein
VGGDHGGVHALVPDSVKSPWQGADHSRVLSSGKDFQNLMHSIGSEFTAGVVARLIAKPVKWEQPVKEKTPISAE